MDGAEQNPNVWSYEEATCVATEEQRLRTSPEHVAEQVQQCIGCIAARDGEDAEFGAQTIATCGSVSVHATNEALKQAGRAWPPLVEYRGSGVYGLQPDAHVNAVVPPDCYETLSAEQKALRDTRTISQKYLDAGILACFGCVVRRNNGEIPDVSFGIMEFGRCSAESQQMMSEAIHRILAMPDSPLAKIKRTAPSNLILTEAAKRYANGDENPAGCQEITGKPLPPSRPAPTPKPPTPVDLTKKRPTVPLHVRQKSTDSMVESCLHCIASRHESYEGLVVSAGKVRLCIGAGLDKTKQSFKRLTEKPDAPLKRDNRQMFRLTNHAKQENPWGTPANCQSITFKPRRPKGDDPVNKKARRVNLANQAQTRQLTIQRHVVEACVETIPDPHAREGMANHLQALLACDALTVKRAAIDQQPSVVAHRGRSAWFYFAPGKKMSTESPGMQRAFFLAHGLDRFIYGQPTDVAELRQELQLHPTDSLRAVGRLVAYKLIHQLPPFEYTVAAGLEDD